MTTANPAAPAASFRKIKKAAYSIEMLEPRAYLTGVVFGPPQTLNASAAGIAPVFTNLDDVNGDGKADLIVTNQASGAVPNSVSVLLGNGNGTFGAAQTIALPAAPLPLAESDLRHTGHLDIVTGNHNGTVSVLFNNGSGSFTLNNSYSTGLANAQAIALGDFNGDGKPDIAIVGDDTNLTNNLVVLINNGDGTFAAPVDYSIPHAHLAAITTFTSTQVVGGLPTTVTNLAIADQDGGSVTVMLNNGDGTFRSGADYTVGTAPVSISSADFNTDSKSDLVVANSGGGSVSVLLGNGDGTFQSAVNTAVPGVPAGGGPLKVRVANMNNDGKPDLLMLLSSGSSADAAVMLGNGDGTFHTGTLIQTGGAQRAAIAAGDLNGDGLTDVVVADPTQVATLLNITNQDTAAPTASVDITQPAPTPGSATLLLTVTYSDAFQIDASTLQTGNVTVTDPHGNAQTATLVSMNLGNAQSVTATYQINAPSGSLSQADDGVYTLFATPNSALAVKNANGIPLPGGTIGTFDLQVPISGNGPNLTAGPIQAKLPAAVVGGTRARGGARLTVTNTGNATAAGTIVINLYASPIRGGIPGNAPLLASVSKKINLKPGKRVVISFPKFNWPSGVNGSFFLVANVNATDTIQETNFSDNVGSSATSTKIAPPFVDIANLWNASIPATLVAGKRVSLNVALKNNGNVPAKGTATITVFASSDTNPADGTTIASVPVRLNIAPGKTATAHVRFTASSSLAHGSYHMIVVVSFPGDTNPGNDTAASSATFSI